MHAFDRRLNQLLDRVADLSAGRRQRLMRTLRQDDVELGVRAEDASLDAAMKASLRVAAHEVLDVFCMHLEGALARCRSDEARTLLAAVAAIALAEHACVLFEADGEAAGVEFIAQETIYVAASPQNGVDLRLSLRRGDNRTSELRGAEVTAAGLPAARQTVSVAIAGAAAVPDADVVLAPGDIAADPFEHAAALIERLRHQAERPSG